MSDFSWDINSRQSLQRTGKPPTTKSVEPIRGFSAILESVPSGKVVLSVVILTALTEEFLAIEKHLSSCQEIIHPEGTFYKCGTFESEDAVWIVAIVETGKGNRRAATETQRAIRYFEPDIVLFVGIAGGRRETKIGDVVAANKVYNYESGRDEVDLRSRPEVEGVSYRLEQAAKAVVRDWRCQKDKAASHAKIFNAFVGAIAAGEKVIASTDSTTNQQIEQNYGDTYAVEMEGYGFLGAAREVKNVPALVVRGISDVLDGKEAADKSGSQPLAARNASKFAFDLLTRLANFSSKKKDSAGKTEEPLAELDPVEIALDKKPLSEIAIVWFQKDEGSYRLRAWHQAMKKFDATATQMTIPIPIGSFVTETPWTLDTIGSLRLYDPRRCLVGGLLKWLRYLKKLEPLFSCLVIKEPHSSTVPWELLNLERKPLGITLQTVRSRFTDDDEDLTTQTELWKDSDNRCEGQAIVYVPSKGENEVKSYFPGSQSYIFDSFSHEEPEQVLAHLRKVDSQVGLVVMSDSALKTITRERRAAYLYDTKVWQENPSLVMLQLTAGKDDGRVQREWAAALLDNGVKGILGMLESPDDSVSQQIVNAFFLEYERAPDLPIPELLKRLRATVTQASDSGFKKDLCTLYLASFLYAYYGHPKAVLRLTKSDP